MRILIALVLALTSTASAEERSIAFVNPLNSLGIKEFSTVLRVVADVPKLFFDTENKSVSFDGTPEQLSRAEWLIHQLDKPAGWQPSQQERENPSAREYQGELRVYFMSGNPGARSVQEVLTILRTVLDVQRIYNFTSLHAVAWRGTPVELDAAEWVLKQIDLPTGSVHSDSGLYSLPDDRPHFNTMRVFYLPAGTGDKEMQRLVTALRTAPLSVMKVFTYSAGPAIVVRGTSAQIDQSATIIDKFRKSPA